MRASDPRACNRPSQHALQLEHGMGAVTFSQQKTYTHARTHTSTEYDTSTHKNSLPTCVCVCVCGVARASLSLRNARWGYGRSSRQSRNSLLRQLLPTIGLGRRRRQQKERQCQAWLTPLVNVDILPVRRMSTHQGVLHKEAMITCKSIILRF